MITSLLRSFAVTVVISFFPLVEMASANPPSTQAVHGGDIVGNVTRCGSAVVRGEVYIAGQSDYSKTNSNGDFKLLYVQPGGHTLTVEIDGNIFLTLSGVSVTKNKTTQLGTLENCPDADNDGFDESSDCNDHNPNVNPGATEACDGIDNNCDGDVDEGCPECTDADADGFYAQQGCNTAVDCNDQNPAINPLAQEICSDGVDNNCDGQVDENCLNCTPGATCDTGSPGVCSQGVYNTSCTCVALNSAAQEICDGLDNDCDGATDNNLALGPCGNNIGQCVSELTCSNGVLQCQQLVPPSAEICDSTDNNCDGQIDEGGICDVQCTAPLTNCGGQCVNLSSNVAHCGQCGSSCGSGFVCTSGQCLDINECVPNPCGSGSCTQTVGGGYTCQCPFGTTFDGATCVPS